MCKLFISIKAIIDSIKESRISKMEMDGIKCRIWDNEGYWVV